MVAGRAWPHQQGRCQLGTHRTHTPIGAVDNQPLATDDLGEISGEVKLSDSYQPYLGIGWGRVAGGKGGFSFTADIGVAMLDPEVELDATVNPGGTNGLNQADMTLDVC